MASAILCIHRNRKAKALAHSFGMCLLRATLALMVGGCVLVGSTHGCRRVQGKHEKQPWQVQPCAFIATVRPKRWRTALACACSVLLLH